MLRARACFCRNRFAWTSARLLPESEKHVRKHLSPDDFNCNSTNPCDQDYTYHKCEGGLVRRQDIETVRVSVACFFAKRSSMFRWHTNPTQLPLVPWQFCFHSFLVSTIKLLHDQGLLQCVCGLLLHAVGQQPSETGRGQSRALCISHFARV